MAQANWQGITFGATGEQIAASPLKPEKRSERDVIDRKQYVDYELNNYELMAKPFLVRFIMDAATDTLAEVVVHPGSVSRVPGESLCEKLLQILSGKYKAPAANADARSTTFYKTIERTWHADNMSVRLYCLFFQDSAHILINYKPLTAFGDASKL